jgi:phosphate transport system substrate-binding protein
MVRSHSRKKFGQRSAIATTAIAAVVVVIILIVVAGAYLALNPGKGSTITIVSTQSGVNTTVTESGSGFTTIVTTNNVGSTVTITSGTTATATTTAIGQTTSAQQVTITGAGSTFVYPIMSAWAYNYSQAFPNVRINYASIGSGAGIAQITAGTVNFGASDAPLSSAQYGNLSSKGILQIPETSGGVVPAYNLPGIASGLKFNGIVLAGIYLGNITMWNDPVLQQLNPGVTLPAKSIFVVHRSDGSGTTFVWTDYLSQASPKWNSTVGKGTAVNWPLGFGSKGSEGVSGVIQGNQYSIGYMESAYATQDKLTFGSVKNAAGNFVIANSTTVVAAVSAAASLALPAGNQSWASVSIIDSIFHNSTATLAYPITSFTYLMVYRQQTNQAIGQALANFIWWIVNTAGPHSAPLGYYPLAPAVVAIDDATLKSMSYNGQPLITSS